MARQRRIEYPGAVYHVIARGNYRKDLFTIGKSGEAFEKALFEVVDRCGWKLHAYVIMSNHYHLVVELSEPNLVDGMRWLQSTFANRFNRFTGERGHVFQGRYKSILIEPGSSLLGLVNYVHLNPVRAGIVEVKNLRTYNLSSYPKHFKRNPLGGLCRKRFLSALNFPDSPHGMRRYTEYLTACEESDATKKNELNRKYCHGWILASQQFRKEILKEYGEKDPGRGFDREVRKDMKAAAWEETIVVLLKQAGKSSEDLAESRKAVQWKIEIAREMRKTSTASNLWLAERLNMGHPSRVSNLIHNNI